MLKVIITLRISNRWQINLRNLNEIPNLIIDLKVIYIEGQFDGDDPAVAILEKTHFEEKQCTKILKVSNDEQPTETFRNDIYSGYTLQPERDLNGNIQDESNHAPSNLCLDSHCSSADFNEISIRFHVEIKVTVIYPATQKHIEKYSRQEFSFVRETADLYREKVEPFLRENNFSVQWVYNILERKKEQESILFEDADEKVDFNSSSAIGSRVLLSLVALVSTSSETQVSKPRKHTFKVALQAEEEFHSNFSWVSCCART